MPNYAKSMRGPRAKVHKTYDNQSWTHCNQVQKDLMIQLTTEEAAAYLEEHPDALCTRCFGKVAPHEVRVLWTTTK